MSIMYKKILIPIPIILDEGIIPTYLTITITHYVRQALLDLQTLQVIKRELLLLLLLLESQT